MKVRTRWDRRRRTTEPSKPTTDNAGNYGPELRFTLTMYMLSVVRTARTLSRHRFETALSSSVRPNLSPTCNLLSIATSRTISQASQQWGNRSRGGSEGMKPVCWSMSNTLAMVDISVSTRERELAMEN